MDSSLPSPPPPAPPPHIHIDSGREFNTTSNTELRCKWRFPCTHLATATCPTVNDPKCLTITNRSHSSARPPQAQLIEAAVRETLMFSFRTAFPVKFTFTRRGSRTDWLSSVHQMLRTRTYVESEYFWHTQTIWSKYFSEDYPAWPPPPKKKLFSSVSTTPSPHLNPPISHTAHRTIDLCFPLSKGK